VNVTTGPTGSPASGAGCGVTRCSAGGVVIVEDAAVVFERHAVAPAAHAKTTRSVRNVAIMG
jgi:hypothetical protein